VLAEIELEPRCNDRPCPIPYNSELFEFHAFIFQIKSYTERFNIKDFSGRQYHSLMMSPSTPQVHSGDKEEREFSFSQF
jgi:hypothetical protein